MTSHTMFVLELVLFDGVAVGVGVWQYWTVRPTKKVKPDEPSALARASRENARHPEG